MTKKLPENNYCETVEAFAQLIPDPVQKLKFLKDVVNIDTLSEVNDWPIPDQTDDDSTRLANQDTTSLSKPVNSSEPHIALTTFTDTARSQRSESDDLKITKQLYFLICIPLIFSCVIVLAMLPLDVEKVVAVENVANHSQRNRMRKQSFGNLDPEILLAFLTPAERIPADIQSIFSQPDITIPNQISHPKNKKKYSHTEKQSKKEGDTLKVGKAVSKNDPKDAHKRKGKKYPSRVFKHFPEYLDKQIWLVEKKAGSEFYSNRLHIITSFSVKNIPRKYYRFPKNTIQLPSTPKMSNKISGILYHTSESDIFDFKPEMNTSIKKYSKALIRYVRKERSYHYFIDRFGQVYRLVRDDHAAFHSGNSIWSDDTYYYLNLNHAFIGICFEGRDFKTVDPDMINKEGIKKGRQPKIMPMKQSTINEAQLKSGKELTDFLRVKYNISQHNCVPHGLASINPRTLLLGHHLDLSHSFPFEKFELNNKYVEPIPAVTDFGFTIDNYFKQIFQGNVWPGFYKSEKIIEAVARKQNLEVLEYKKKLRKKFQILFEWQVNVQEHDSLGIAMKN